MTSLQTNLQLAAVICTNARRSESFYHCQFFKIWFKGIVQLINKSCVFIFHPYVVSKWLVFLRGTKIDLNVDRSFLVLKRKRKCIKVSKRPERFQGFWSHVLALCEKQKIQVIYIIIHSSEQFYQRVNKSFRLVLWKNHLNSLLISSLSSWTLKNMAKDSCMVTVCGCMIFHLFFLPKSYHITSEELEYSTQVVWTILNILMLFVLLMLQSLHIVILWKLFFCFCIHWKKKSNRFRTT